MLFRYVQRALSGRQLRFLPGSFHLRPSLPPAVNSAFVRCMQTYLRLFTHVHTLFVAVADAGTLDVAGFTRTGGWLLPTLHSPRAYVLRHCCCRFCGCGAWTTNRRYMVAVRAFAFVVLPSSRRSPVSGNPSSLPLRSYSRADVGGGPVGMGGRFPP
jgi:hypothetical protein